MLSGKDLAHELKALKDSKNMSVNHISDLSGIPSSTISRVLSGQTDNPSFQTIYDIVKAMDGSLDALTGISSPLSGAEKQMYERLLSEKDEIIKSKDKIIKGKDKWITRLFIISIVAALIAMAYIVYDICNGNIGVIRY